MVCLDCGIEHQPSAICERLNTVAQSLDLYAVPAFLTDRYNRFIWVNAPFARLVGDPIRDGLPPNLRFIAASMLGPFRERFPRRKAEVASCLPGLFSEVADGRLALPTRRLIQETLALDEEVRRLVERKDTAWDGTVLVKDRDGRLLLVREQVIPIADIQGRANGYHIILWLPAEKHVPQSLQTPVSTRSGIVASLTPRQLEIARWYADGLNSRAVAKRANISHRTARDHLEEIYSRLDIHSRAELAALLVREGLA